MNQHLNIFIDETGSPQFFATRKRPLWTEADFVPITCIGMITTDDRKTLRQSVLSFHQSILDDPLLNSIYSVCQPGWFLHARCDHSDINLKMVEFIRQLKGFTFNAIIGRKIPEIFFRKHNGNSTEFYFDLIHQLLSLRPLKSETCYHLYLSQRQSNTEQRFTEAFKKVLSGEKKENGITYKCTVVRSRDFPELSVVDYLLWALQRYILKDEKRYFTALAHHYEQILDVYESKGQGRIYDANDPFDMGKVTPFNIG